MNIQRFIEPYYEGSVQLSIDGVDEPASSFTYGPGGNVTAPVVPVNTEGCSTSDFPASVAGNIALIQRGTCSFSIKVGNAGAAGAVGAIIYNNVDGDVAGTLGTPQPVEGSYVPVAGLSKARGDALLAATQAGTVTAELNAYGLSEDRVTYNVIAQSKGGDKNSVVMAGSHTDSVTAGPGINDNGSGSVALLEIAQQLAKSKSKLDNALRFGWWSAEEYGLLGAEYYVSQLSLEERNKIRIYLNFDMIASPNYVYAIYDGDGSAFNVSGPAGSAQAEQLFEKYFESQGLAHVPSDFDGRSDYGPFLDAGIACGGLFTGAEVNKTEEEARLFGGQAGVAYDSNYHQAGDDFSNLNAEAFVTNAKAIAHSLATYAGSVESLGPKDPAVAPTNERAAGPKAMSLHRCGETISEM